MKAGFVSGRVWPSLTRAAGASRRRSVVAVAYFGQGASRLLPLSKGSRLVVDASEGAVKAGQTCPDELLLMIKRGVRVFSVANIHAKVFVLGRVAFIGSANVSRRSADCLIEAAVRISDPKTVRAAREFVAAQCLHEQTPLQLKRLAKIYRPPRVPGGQGRAKEDSESTKIATVRPALPRLLLAQLVREDWNQEDQRLHDAGEGVARKRRQHPRSFVLDSFRYTGQCRYRRGDIVIQITDEGSSRRMMDAPGNVLYVRTRWTIKRQVSFIYVERPATRPRAISTIAKKLGRGASKHLVRNGLVRNATFRESLLKLWGA
jgi:hypothetical protein